MADIQVHPLRVLPQQRHAYRAMYIPLVLIALPECIAQQPLLVTDATTDILPLVGQ